MIELHEMIERIARAVIEGGEAYIGESDREADLSVIYAPPELDVSICAFTVHIGSLREMLKVYRDQSLELEEGEADQLECASRLRALAAYCCALAEELEAGGKRK